MLDKNRILKTKAHTQNSSIVCVHTLAFKYLSNKPPESSSHGTAQVNFYAADPNTVCTLNMAYFTVIKSRIFQVKHSMENSKSLYLIIPGAFTEITPIEYV